MHLDDDKRPALEGLTVLDASRVLAGPYCTMILSDLGATVLKIERPSLGDETRAWGPPYLGDPSLGMSAYFLSVNRGKRSLCLDLKTKKGREVFLDLIRQSDIFVENFAPGVADRLGLDDSTITAANPRLIHCSITAFGDHAGPGYDLVIQGMSGLMSVTGESTGPPLKVGVAITDVIAGWQAVSAILAAVMTRQRTGRGERISIGLLNSAVTALVNIGQDYLVQGESPQRWGNSHPHIVPYQVFKAKDGYLTVAAGNNEHFVRLCQVVGRSEWTTDSRFATNSNRVANRQRLISELETLFAEKTVDQWLAELRKAEIPCGPVADLAALFDGREPPPGVEMLELETSSGATYRTVGRPLKRSGPMSQPSGAPLVGEHTDEILREMLNLDDQQLAMLRKKSVIE